MEKEWMHTTTEKFENGDFTLQSLVILDFCRAREYLDFSTDIVFENSSSWKNVFCKASFKIVTD